MKFKRTFTAAEDAEYAKSNAIDAIVALNGFKCGCREELVNAAEDARTRYQIGQRYYNMVCDRLRVARIRLVVRDGRQLHRDGANGRMRSKTLGRYRHIGSQGVDIEIWNKTAKLGKVVSPKVFWNTLCHELCHHIDCTLFGFTNSFHCAGFYKRVSFLESLG